MLSITLINMAGIDKYIYLVYVKQFKVIYEKAYKLAEN